MRNEIDRACEVPSACGRRALPWAASAAALLLAAAGGADDGWEVLERSDAAGAGYVLYIGGNGDGRYPSYKLETLLEAAPAEAAASTMTVMTSPHMAPEGQRRKLLSQNGDETVIYTFIDMPMMVSDRDVALRVTRNGDAESGVHRISWTADGNAAPPPPKKVVRLPEAHGYWEFAPDGPGRSRATYVTHADLGGSLPPWLVKPMMREQVAGDVDNLREVIRKRSTTVSAPPPSDP